MGRLNKETKPDSGRNVKPKQPKSLRKLAIAFAIVIAALVLYVVYIEPHTLSARQRIQLESTQQELTNAYKQKSELEAQSAKDKAAQAAELNKLQEKLKKTQKELQAKRSVPKAPTAIAATPSTPQPIRPAPRPSVKPSGTCASWIAQAGIADVANANELIRRESGCNPNAMNPSSGACGVAQELPCGKSGCSLGDGACQVRWMDQYVKARYGSWAAAVAFHNANNWY